MNVGCSIGATAFNKMNVILLNALYRRPNVILVSDSVQCHSAESNSTGCHSVACHSAERHFGCWMMLFWISFWCLSLCWMPLCLMSFCKMSWWHLKVKGALTCIIVASFCWALFWWASFCWMSLIKMSFYSKIFLQNVMAPFHFGWMVDVFHVSVIQRNIIALDLIMRYVILQKVWKPFNFGCS